MKRPRGRPKKEIEGKRLTITVSEEIYKLLHDVKRVTGEPCSKQIVNLLTEMRPALEMVLEIGKTVQALDNAKKKEIGKVAKEFEASFEALSEKARSLAGETNQQMDMFTGAVFTGSKKAGSEGSKKAGSEGSKKAGSEGSKKAGKMA